MRKLSRVFGFLFRFWGCAYAVSTLRRVKRINFIQFLSFHEMYKHITLRCHAPRPPATAHTTHLSRASNQNQTRTSKTKPDQGPGQTKPNRTRTEQNSEQDAPCLHCTFAVLWDFSGLCPTAGVKITASKN